eukprot:6150228-Alexandrium_andersonii.AAC.1
MPESASQGPSGPLGWDHGLFGWTSGSKPIPAKGFGERADVQSHELRGQHRLWCQRPSAKAKE